MFTKKNIFLFELFSITVVVKSKNKVWNMENFSLEFNNFPL